MADVNTKSEWLDAVLKMIELTQKGKMEWGRYSIDAAPTTNPNDRVVSAFAVNHLGQRLLLTRRYQKSSGFTYKLQFINEEGRLVYSVPDLDALKNLFEEVNLQVINVRSYLDELLKQ